MSMSNQIVGLQGIESEEKVWITPCTESKLVATPVLLEEINKVLEHEVTSRHSYFQLRYFLIGKEPTNQGKMWQCLRELKTRKESLESIDLELAETKDRLELLDINIEDLRKDSNQKVVTIKIRQAERQRKAIETNIVSLGERKKWLEEESKFFLETFKSIQKMEPLKSFDDLESQKQYWGEKLAQKLNLKMLTGNALDSDLIETIMSLPDDVPLKKQTVTTLNVRHAKMLKDMKETLGRIEGK